MYRSVKPAFAALLFLGFAPFASAQITAQFTPSVTSGVAPLAVHFDATATTHTDGSVNAFHDLTHRWDFGDPGSGNWTTGALRGSRNEDYGPIAGHVFEQPGTYTVRLSVYDGRGATATRTATITVTNPNTVFSGTQTACIARDGNNWSGCPTGARQVVRADGDFDAALAAELASNRRILFRRGQSWTANAGINLSGRTTGIIGAFGTGTLPALSHTGGDFLFQTNGTDWRIMDLAVTGTGSNQFSAGSGPRNTFVRVDLRTYEGSWVQNSDLFTIYDSKSQDVRVGNVTFLAARRGLVLGNDGRNSLQGEHIWRLPEFTRSVFAHNTAAAAAEGRHLLKLHASRDHTSASEFWVVRDNFFDNTHSGIPVQIGPQNDSTNCNEIIRQGIFESNYLTNNANSGFGMWLVTQNVTVRNNVLNMSVVRTMGFEAIWSRGQECQPLPRDNRILNNTIYGGRPQFAVGISLQANPVNTIVRNNLLYSTSPTTVVENGGTGTVMSNNFDNDGGGGATAFAGNPFVSATPTQMLDFRLAPGAAVLNRGAVVPWVATDLMGANRAAVGPGPASGDGAWDVGAFELNTGGPAPDTTPPAAPVLLQE